ncbi:unnamed protein product, partial [Ectocarpus sp. 12 AP-2014]
MDRGGGTWLHPKLAVPFARWLSVDFKIWCDEQIDRLIHGGAEDWQQRRDSASIGYRGMCDALQLTREAQGKPFACHHFINRAGFWRSCNEIADNPKKSLRQWFLNHRQPIPWPYGKAPTFELKPLGGGHFKLYLI